MSSRDFPPILERQLAFFILPALHAKLTAKLPEYDLFRSFSCPLNYRSLKFTKFYFDLPFTQRPNYIFSGLFSLENSRFPVFTRRWGVALSILGKSSENMRYCLIISKRKNVKYIYNILTFLSWFLRVLPRESHGSHSIDIK
jgi:hypothetical protein